MKKLLLIVILMFSSVANTSAEVSRIISGNENAKITIIAYESLTCSHCASFHEEVYPHLEKDYIDTGLAKIEFRHFPLDIASLNAAKIAQCKEAQGLEILSSLYSNQQAWVKGNSIDDINKNIRKSGLKRMFLHAFKIGFSLPCGKNIFIEAPMPSDLSEHLMELDCRDEP